MSIFNQLIPRLSRSLDRAEANGSSQPEYAVKPAYRISETPEAWSLTAHLPGVTKEGLEVTAEEGVVSIRGKRAWQKPELKLVRTAGMLIWAFGTADPRPISQRATRTVAVELTAPSITSASTGRPARQCR